MDTTKYASGTHRHTSGIKYISWKLNTHNGHICAYHEEDFVEGHISPRRLYERYDWLEAAWDAIFGVNN